MINLTKEQQTQCDKVMGKISLEKDRAALSDHVVNLSKCMVDISKKANVDLCNQVARVVVVLDYSGSMDTLYRSGTIQRTLNRLVPLGLSFDDNGELEVYLFQNTCMRLQEMTLENYETYKEEVIDTCGYYMGGTSYAPVIKEILKDTGKYSVSKKTGFFSGFGKSAAPTKTGEKVFVIFITDGANNDRPATDEVIRESALTDTFIQFIGLGRDSFDYLRELDDLSGRAIDNTGFTNLNDLSKISDEDLYTLVLEQFADWLRVI